jgi:hypothetical protein
MKMGYREVAEIVGVASIVGSLIFVGMEMNQTQQIALNERSYSMVESGIEQYNSIIGHPDIWARGNAGEDMTNADMVVYEYQIQTVWHIAFWNTQTQRRFGSNLDIALNDFAGFLHRNPGARVTWENTIDQLFHYRTLLSVDLEISGLREIEAVREDLEYLDNIKIE